MDQAQLAQLQEQLARQVIIPPEGEGYRPQPGDLLFSLDVQYREEIAYVAVDVQAWPDRFIGTYVGTAEVTVPYIPQFFCFREGPPLLEMIGRVAQRLQRQPALILVEGHGLAHPRRLGIACWVGLQTGIPTLGCAKSTLLPYHRGSVELLRGNYEIIEDRGEPVGAALVTQAGVKPIFASPGHKVSLGTTIEVILRLAARYRLPEPLRRADRAARGGAQNKELVALKEAVETAPPGRSRNARLRGQDSSSPEGDGRR
jgi:deoxyribonuclease V